MGIVYCKVGSRYPCVVSIEVDDEVNHWEGKVSLEGEGGVGVVKHKNDLIEEGGVNRLALFILTVRVLVLVHNLVFFQCPVIVNVGTLGVWPGLGGKTNGVSLMRVDCVGGMTRLC